MTLMPLSAKFPVTYTNHYPSPHPQVPSLINAQIYEYEKRYHTTVYAVYIFLREKMDDVPARFIRFGGPSIPSGKSNHYMPDIPVASVYFLVDRFSGHLLLKYLYADGSSHIGDIRYVTENKYNRYMKNFTSAYDFPRVAKHLTPLKCPEHLLMIAGARS